MAETDHDGVPAAALAVTGLGVRGGVTGHLHEGFGATGADRFGEQLACRVGLAGERRDGCGDDQAGFGVQPAIESPPAIQRLGQVQMLGGMLTRRRIRGLVRRRRSQHFLSHDPELPGGQRGGLLGQECFQISGEVDVKIAGRLLNDRRMIQSQLAGLPAFGGDRHPVGQRPADLHPLGHPTVGLTRDLPDERLRRSRPIRIRTRPVRPLDQPARQQIGLPSRAEHLRQHLDRQTPRRISGNSSREFGSQRMQLRRLHPELSFDHVFDSSSRAAAQPLINRAKSAAPRTCESCAQAPTAASIGA